MQIEMVSRFLLLCCTSSVSAVTGSSAMASPYKLLEFGLEMPADHHKDYYIRVA